MKKTPTTTLRFRLRLERTTMRELTPRTLATVEGAMPPPGTADSDAVMCWTGR